MLGKDKLQQLEKMMVGKKILSYGIRGKKGIGSPIPDLSGSFIRKIDIKQNYVIIGLNTGVCLLAYLPSRRFNIASKLKPGNNNISLALYLVSSKIYFTCANPKISGDYVWAFDDYIKCLEFIYSSPNYKLKVSDYTKEQFLLIIKEKYMNERIYDALYKIGVLDNDVINDSLFINFTNPYKTPSELTDKKLMTIHSYIIKQERLLEEKKKYKLLLNKKKNCPNCSIKLTEERKRYRKYKYCENCQII